MSYKIKVLTDMYCEVACTIHNDNRCCINCGLDTFNCTNLCRFMVDKLYVHKNSVCHNTIKRECIRYRNKKHD